MKNELEESSEELLATFRIDDAWYGVDAMHLQEVILTQNFTKVYGAPAYVRGIINLRGKIVTVIEPYKKMGLTQSLASGGGCVLIVPWMDEQMGLLVDEMLDVIDLKPEQLLRAPANSEEGPHIFYKGIYKENSRLITILDLNELLCVKKSSAPDGTLSL